MNRKSRKFWVIGGVGLLLVVAASIALVVPHKPYGFLKDATLQNIELYTVPTYGTGPTAGGRGVQSP